MISVTQLRAGTVFEEDGQPYLVLKYEHTKMGRGTANIKLKIKSLKSKVITEKTFISGARVQESSLARRRLQYLYREGENFCFMDPKSFDQVFVSGEVVANQEKFLREGALVDVLFWPFDSFGSTQDKSAQGKEETPIGLELPPKMEFNVIETGPGVKGDSATNIFKPATLDNGVTIKVPLFIETGEKILVDTRTGEYVKRVK